MAQSSTVYIDGTSRSLSISSDLDQIIDSLDSLISDNPRSSLSGLTESGKTEKWKGSSMNEIHKGHGPFDYQEDPPIKPSKSHHVLFKLPLDNRGPPTSFPVRLPHKCVVMMPYSCDGVYSSEKESKPGEFHERWNVIQKTLQRKMISCAQLEAAILSYNRTFAEQWNFAALRHFFSEVIDGKESEMFFSTLLPKMVQLAIQLPNLITGAIPILKRHTNSTISLSQLQVASLLANAFFCTFPMWNPTLRQSGAAPCPYLNFHRLFAAYGGVKLSRSAAISEKLKCLLHYFKRVTSTTPKGTITIQRRYIPREDCPKWQELSDQLVPLHITSEGSIESDGAGLLQVDFANKNIGGGVLDWGCVQEEIRFLICPELIVTRLVTETLDDTEAIIVTGAECYSEYEGYGDSFIWAGDFVDATPRDSSGRRRTAIVAIDAIRFSHTARQFTIENVTRELNKAYVGFSLSEMVDYDLPAVATGNWGCGAFRGDPRLKSLIQLMAATAAQRSMAYFTFGDSTLRDSIAEMYGYLVNEQMDIGKLFSLLQQYDVAIGMIQSHSRRNKKTLDFYEFLSNPEIEKTKFANSRQNKKVKTLFERLFNRLISK